MADEISIIVKAEDQFSSVLGNFGNILTGIKSGIDLVAGAFNAAVGFVTPFLDSANESEQAIANLEATLHSMGDVTGLTSTELQALAEQIQRTTRFSDEMVLNGEAMLLTFGNIGGDIFPRATEAMVDLAAKFGSVDQASVMLGKALNDPIAGVSALRRVGVQLSEEQTQQIKDFMAVNDIASAQGIILGELERQVGGLAEAYGDTFAGQLDIFKNKIDSVKEGIGGLIQYALKPVLEYLNGDTSIGIAIETVASALGTLNDYLDKGVPLFQALGLVIAELPNHTDLIAELPTWLRSIADTLFDMQSILDEGGSIWDALGFGLDNIAAGINNFVSSGGLDAIVDSVVDFLNGIGTSPQFDNAALNGAMNILRALGNAFMSVDWGALVTAFDGAIGRLIANIDWHALGDKFGQAIANLFSGAGGFSVPTSTLSAIGDAISDFMIGAMGYVSWQQLGDAIMAGLNQIDLNAQAWVNDHIIVPIKNALGISSPSSIFYSIGVNIVMGLINGFMGMSAPLITAVMSIVNAVLDIFQPVLDVLGVDTGSGSMGGGVATHVGPGGSTGTAGGGTAGGTSPSGGTSGQVVNNYYGPVYFQGGVEPGSYYDCPSPNPLLVSSQGGLVMPSIG